MAYISETQRPTANRSSRRRFSIWAMLVQMHRLARQRQVLATLEPDQLRDIGISAYDAKKEADRPVWDIPSHWR